ncbi:MAG: amidohydrolase family protein, partial [Lachnospiraceae bacterium]|nr:amidohydrolase family protein [Lachnospiraceae bacterium]
QKAGFRVLLAPMLHDITDSQILYHVPAAPGAFPSVSEYYNFYTNFISQFHRPDGTSQVMVGINSPQRASHELLELAHFLSETYDLNIHCHLLETKWQKLSAQISKEEPIKKLTDHSLLSNKTSLAHCIWLDDKDLQLISYNHAYIVANPESNCFLGSGILPLRQIKRYGIPVAIGSDAGNCGANHNLISSLRLLLQLDRIQDYTNESGKNLISFQDYHDWYSMAEGFSMLSQTAASLAGYSNLGSIAPGFLADLVTFDKKALVNTGENFLLQQFIFHSSFHAKEVFIHGKHILKHGTITCLDENELYQKLEQRLPALRGLIANALKETCTERELYDRMYSSFHD